MKVTNLSFVTHSICVLDACSHVIHRRKIQMLRQQRGWWRFGKPMTLLEMKWCKYRGVKGYIQNERMGGFEREHMKLAGHLPQSWTRGCSRLGGGTAVSIWSPQRTPHHCLSLQASPPLSCLLWCYSNWSQTITHHCCLWTCSCWVSGHATAYLHTFQVECLWWYLNIVHGVTY